MSIQRLVQFGISGTWPLLGRHRHIVCFTASPSTHSSGGLGVDTKRHAADQALVPLQICQGLRPGKYCNLARVVKQLVQQYRLFQLRTQCLPTTVPYMSCCTCDCTFHHIMTAAKPWSLSFTRHVVVLDRKPSSSRNNKR